MLTPEQEQAIYQELLQIFQDRYGEQWRTKLTTNLRPSPIDQIAEQFGVSVSDVRKVRAKIMLFGLLLQSVAQEEV